MARVAERESSDGRFLAAAIEEARAGLAEGGVPVGAALVVDGELVATGRNRRVQWGSVIRHGETDCLENAGRLPGSVYARATMYTTLSPCHMCSGAILLYGIPRVVMGENRTFLGAEELLDAHGDEVPKPFLELFEELWDSDGKRFTLLLHPGRIKRGLIPREELGPILEDGKSYTLVVAADWPDANGNPLKAGYRKQFSVGPPREKQLDPKEWQIAAPARNGSSALEVHFPFPLDHAMLERVLSVVDHDGQTISGTIRIDDGERRWLFTPNRNWMPGRYRLTIETTLEDSAGNSVARPFELDLVQPRPEQKARQAEIEFDVK